MNGFYHIWSVFQFKIFPALYVFGWISQWRLENPSCIEGAWLFSYLLLWLQENSHRKLYIYYFYSWTTYAQNVLVQTGKSSDPEGKVNYVIINEQKFGFILRKLFSWCLRCVMLVGWYLKKFRIWDIKRRHSCNSWTNCQ